MLDTSVVISIFKGKQAVLDGLAKWSGININTVTLGELYLGVYRSADSENKVKEIELFLERSDVIDIDRLTAEKYATIKADLLFAGKPIPENDIWIAATALRYQLPLFTLDKHFKVIAELTLIS